MVKVGRAKRKAAISRVLGKTDSLLSHLSLNWCRWGFGTRPGFLREGQFEVYMGEMALLNTTKQNGRCWPKCVYSEVSPIELNGAYSLGNVLRLVALGMSGVGQDKGMPWSCYIDTKTCTEEIKPVP
ncbi:UNVERIFIED_CONTAM: hypothetical protein K2H54_075404 [Gekko kuhli]